MGREEGMGARLARLNNCSQLKGLGFTDTRHLVTDPGVIRGSG